MGARAGDLMIRVAFTGTDRLSRILDGISGKSRGAARELSETNRALGTQQRELRDVQRQMAAANDNTGHLAARERELAADIQRTNARLEKQKKLIEINAKVSRAGVVGHEMMAAGRNELFTAVAMATPLVAIAKAGAQFQNLQNRMRTLGLGEGAVQELTAYAQAMNVAGSSAKDNMRFLLEAQGAFRETGAHDPKEQLAGAKLMAPILAKMHVVDKASGKELSEEEERYMLRFVEQAGGLNDSRRAKQLADGVFRARQSSGGNVNFANYQGFLAAAGSAGTHLTGRSMFADFEPLIAELHEQAGVGLASAYNRATGITKNAAAAKDFMKLGIWDPGKVVLNQMGGVKEFKGNPLQGKAGKLLASDPVEFYRQIVLPAYGRAGIKGEEVTRQNNMLFGRGGGKLFNLIDKQLPTLLRSRDSFKKTQGVDAAYNTTNGGFDGKLAQLKAAGNNFMVAASAKGGLLDNVVSLMGKATAGLKAFTAWGNANPGWFKWIGTIATDLVLVSGGLSILKIAFGGLLGPIGRLWGLSQRIRLAGGFVKAFPLIARLAGVARVAIIFLARGVMQAGLMMLANPLVLAIVAIAAALGVAGYLIYRNWDTIKAAFTRGVAAIAAVWQRVRSAFAAGLSWLSNLLPSFRSIGAMMLEGLLSMLSPGRLVGHIVAMGKSAIGAFKNVLGIRSPSRVFAALGGHMTTGLAQGIDRGAGHPIGRTRALASGLTAAMAVAIAPPGSAYAAPKRAAGAARAAAVPAPVYNITIHAAPGQSADDLARAVALELDRRERTRSTRGASYRDDPDGADL